MQFLEDLFIEPLRVMKAFLLGRGLLMGLTLATWGIAKQFSIEALIPASIVAGAGVVFSGFMRLTNQRVYEDQMLNMYRDGIAQQLGIAPEQVNHAHLKEAAKLNDVIDQALTRQRSVSFVSVATSALAAATTIGLIALGAPAAIAGLFGTGAISAVASFASFAVVSTLSSLVVHDGLQAVIGRRTGLSKAAAHDRIVEMERGIARGWGVSKEQVYGALVAGNPSLENSIQREFGKSYGSMRGSEQAKVLQKIGVADEMLTIAGEINAGRMRPANLAYMMNEAMPRPNKPVAVAAEPAPQRSHVAALSRAPRDEVAGHVARLDAERAMAALGERSV